MLVEFMEPLADIPEAGASSPADATEEELSHSSGFGTVASIALASAIGMDPAGWFPFSVVKWWAVLLAVVVAALFWVRPSRFRMSSLSGWMLVFVLLVTVSGFVALDGAYAWTGTPIRHLGVVAWWVFALAFLVGASIAARSRDAPIPVARAVVVSGAAVVLYSACELLFGRPVEIDVVSDRLGGPYGSPAYLGAACCLIVPVSVAMAADSGGDRRWWGAAVLVASGATVAVVGSGSRGALLSLVVTSSIVGVVTLRAKHPAFEPQRGLVRVAGLVLVSIVAGGIAMARGVFDRSVGWGSRLDEWELAARVIRSRPLLGAGPEGYRIEAFSLVDDDYVRSFGDEVLPDRAHSGVLDVAASSGVFAAVAYAVVMVLVVRSGVRAIRSGSAARTGIGAAVISYAVAQQLLFPIAEIDPLFWLLAGLLCADDVLRRPSDRSLASDTTRSSAARHAATFVGGALVVAVAVVGVRTVAADRVARRAVDEPDARRSAELVDQAATLAPTDIRFHLLLGQAEAAQRTLSSLDRAILAVEKAVDISTLDPAVRIEHARLISLRAEITGSSEDRIRAEREWTRLLDDAPACGRCHFGAALAAGERGDTDEAIELLQRAIGLGNDDARRLLDSLDSEL